MNHDELVLTLAAQLRARGALLATAESCTGGLIAAACTAVSGSSDWFDRGFVTYSNAAKSELLGVPATLIETHGAVSEPVARAMAEGALARSAAQFAVAVTGIAGPTGGTPHQTRGHRVAGAGPTRCRGHHAHDTHHGLANPPARQPGRRARAHRDARPARVDSSQRQPQRSCAHLSAT